MTRRRAVLAAAGFGLCLLVPLVVQQDYQLNVLFRLALFAAVGLAWNLVGGYAGQLSLGHAAFFGIGAYALPLYHDKLGIPIVLALVLVIVTAVAAAYVIGRVSFRLRGPYFALATIAFAEVLRLSAKNLDVTGGDVGLQVPALFGSTSPTRWFYLAAVLLTAAAFATTALIMRSRFGYELQAVREDEDTARACGIDPARTKLHALMISAAFTALGGALYASQYFFIVPDSVLAIDLSEKPAIAAMLGGAGTLTGPIVGAILIEPALELFKTVFQEGYQLIFGVLLVLIVLFLPEGIVGSIASWWRRKHAS
ncbi:MAG TPA: branched-chain amino acid ABC transporter permease [Kofleriaceae bacterium]|nr:branched-chain amino acid ABC transporter permease [Kofleriaceae bacterium]